MTLNLFDSTAGSGLGFVGQNQDNLLNTRDKAVMYIFRPHVRQFEDVAIRPYSYSFDENFLNTASEMIDMVSKNYTRPSVDMYRGNLNDYLMPEKAPSLLVRASNLENHYRFILIITESGSGLITNHTQAASSSSSQMRRIYTGFFNDEPFNPLTHIGGKRTYNRSALLIVTHKTKLNSTYGSGPYGGTMQLSNLRSDEIINPELSKSLTVSLRSNVPSLRLMTPDNLIGSLSFNSDEGTAFSMPGSQSNLLEDQGVIPMADILEMPSENVSTLLNGIMSYQDEQSHYERLSTKRAKAHWEDEFLDEAQKRAKLVHHLKLPRANDHHSEFDFDLNRPISLGFVDDQCDGHLVIQDIDLPTPQFYETADQREIGTVNQFSYLIATVLPPLLNTAGLNRLQFDYQIAESRGQVQRQFRPYGSEAQIAGVPTQDLFSMIKAVEYELINGIFDVIYRSVGAFGVMVDCSVTGNTIVRLNLADHGVKYRNTADFVMPSSLGGLISPMIGDDLIFTSNAQNTANMIDHVTGVGDRREQDDFLRYAANRYEGNSLSTSNGTPLQLKTDMGQGDSFRLD